MPTLASYALPQGLLQTQCGRPHILLLPHIHGDLDKSSARLFSRLRSCSASVPLFTCTLEVDESTCFAEVEETWARPCLGRLAV